MRHVTRAHMSNQEGWLCSCLGLEDRALRKMTKAELRPVIAWVRGVHKAASYRSACPRRDSWKRPPCQSTVIAGVTIRVSFYHDGGVLDWCVIAGRPPIPGLPQRPER